ncbi:MULTISPECIES: hypothetical protein [Halocynthiibacter]|uniref:Uncharacterized protein n=1 Tax=Halocynthiibacter halioticoli TaxID=2986804 RepID=A0AAE3LUU3_9RHOB|nr:MULTISPECIES: hypothetical protein [Halocynthiibacter]MCV6825855.1 hypothetical protein [Halocynthiibacter halioticoli]MCW4058856.1 hypothetical protein [Halocynthiibacter sp. SDUM655004]MDE0588367.1 hypothetical protein [Halocynthiibacter sp. C4]
MTFANLQEKARQGRKDALAKREENRARRKSLAMFFSNRQSKVDDSIEVPAPVAAELDTNIAA